MKLTQIFLILILLIASLLRFYKIDQIPHGLYIDEVSIGYNAHQILTTEKDEYGVSYPLFFKAFGEYKMPVEIYLTSLSMAVFGKTEFAVRFPSAVFGTLTVLLLYFFVKKLLSFKDSLKIENYKLKIPIVAAALLAISPWHIQFSRGGFEANTALFFYLLGGVLFLHFQQKKNYVWLVLSLLSFIVTVYTYNAYKLIVPITLLFIISYYVIPNLSFGKLRIVSLSNLFRNPKKILRLPTVAQDDKFKFGMTILLTVCLLLPVFLFSEGSSRFLATSAFDTQPLFSYPVIYLQNYLSFFSLPFLFATGDGFGRHTIVGMGPLFRWELPFLLIGLFALFKERKTFFALVVFFLLLIAPTAAALTRPSPHMLRSFLLVVPLTIFVAYGIVVLWQKKSKFVKTFVVLFGLVAIYEFGMYMHLYYTHYPMRTALDWGAQYKELVMAASAEQKSYAVIVINSKLGMVPSYSNFYDKTLVYQYIDSTWQKPKDYSKQILYITTSDEKDNTYLQTIPHKHIQDIHLSSSHKGIFAQFWEL